MTYAGHRWIAEISRVTIRCLRMSDGDAMHRIFGDAEVMRYGDGTHTREWVDQWLRDYIEHHYAAWGFGMWSIEERINGEPIGYCGLSRDPKRCKPKETEIGYRLIRDYWGRGLATEAVCAVRDYATGKLRLPTLIAIIDPENSASIRVIEKAGFRFDREVMFEGYTHPDKIFILDAHNR
jgi:RimJ/RimL family protein N-acetyltransferase